MAFDGTGTRSSPILIQDSEEELVQELTHQQFYGPSLTGKHDTTQSHQTSVMAGKRKSREEDEDGGNNLPPSTSLENRISQPESKKARKRRRKAEREALERNKSQNMDWLNSPGSYPAAAGPSQLVPPLQTRLNAERERQHSDFLDEMLRVEKGAADFHDYGAPSRIPSSSTFDSDWVSSMVIAGEFPHCKKVKTSISSKPSPPSAPKSLPAFPPSSEVLPPIHIHPDLVVSTEAPTPTHSPQQALPQTIGMKPEQDPNSKHGIFHATDSTIEAGPGMKKRKYPYMPNPARTLVMEQLPKTHRTMDFVDNWCRSASGVPALHLFVDPPSAKALIEFATADLARKAWASPRLGHDLLGKRSHLLKGKPREDLIKVWWYRVDGVGAGAGVGEIEEGEIEEGEIEEDEKQVAPERPSSPRKETKKERKARLAKERDTKKMATMKENQQQQQKQKQKNVESSSTLSPTLSQPVPSVNVSTPSQVQVTSSQAQMLPLPLASEVIPLPFQSILGSRPRALALPPQVQPFTNSDYSSGSTRSNTAVGSSLAPGARGGHDDSASIASSGGRSSPDRHLSRQAAVVASPSSKIMVVATTVGQADDLADYSEVDMDVDSYPRRDEAIARSAPLPTRQKAISSNTTQPSAKGNALPLRPSMLATPNFIDGKLAEARSKQPSHVQSHSQTPTLATVRHPVVPPFIFKNHPSHQSQPSSPVSSPSTTFASISHVSDSSQHTPVASIPSKPFPLGPIQAARASKTPLPPRIKVNTNVVHSKQAALFRSKLDKQISKSKMELVVAGNPTTPASSYPAPSLVSAVPATVTSTSSSSDSAGQAMEENLRQLVFASKRARASGVQSHSSPSQLRSSTSADMNMTAVHNFAGKVMPTSDAQANEKNEVVNLNTAETPVSAPVPPASNPTSLNRPTADIFSFEDLAITFITQTIENVKANNQPQPDPQSVDSSLGSTSTPCTSAVVGLEALPPPSASSNAAAGAVVPDKLPLATNSSANLTKSELTKFELSVKQMRLEKYLQESKSLMERISTARTKPERDLLLKLMSQKIRLFEEENKAGEKRRTTSIGKPTQSKTRTTAVLQFQQWPTTQSNTILVLSDDED